nr:replicative DNA helicase [Candidatus Omnitrophota bacterium]
MAIQFSSTAEFSRSKTLPHNIEAEAAVIGSMLIDDLAIPQAIEKLRAESFYHPPHKQIFRALITLFEANKAVDLITLTETLTQDQTLDAVGGAAYISELSAAVPTSANIGYYIKIVHEKYILRSLIHSATQIAQE